MNQKRLVWHIAFIAMVVTLLARGGSAQQSVITNAGKTKPALTITSISPSSAATGSPALTLTVQGVNFIKGSTVLLSGSARVTTFVSSTQLQAQVTQADLATAGTFAVTVVTSKGAGSNSLTFTIVAPAPSPTPAPTPLPSPTPSPQPSPSPSPTPLPSPTPNPTPTTPSISTLSPVGAAQGTTALNVIVKGANFAANSTVQVNGSSRNTIVVSDSRLQVQLTQTDLASVGSLTVTVVNSLGNSNSVTFTVAPDKLVYGSRRALDGSNGLNCNPFCSGLGSSSIWAQNPDGSGAVPLTALDNDADAIQPVWSPDGAKIAFSSNILLDPKVSSGASNLFVMNADGTGLTPLTHYVVGNVQNVLPVWSPDGARIAYVSDGAFDGSDAIDGLLRGAFNVWVMNADGTAATPLTRVAADVTDQFRNVISSSTFHPAWSPDSSQIAYHSKRALDGSNQLNVIITNADGSLSVASNIWVINADGTGDTPLTRSTGPQSDNLHPVWSPGGVQIAFDSQVDPDNPSASSGQSNSNVWVMNADGSLPTPLVRLHNASSRLPAWSPDGSRIAYQSTRALDGSDSPNGLVGNSNIWAMNSDGGFTVPVTFVTTGIVNGFADSGNANWTADASRIIFESNRAVDGSNAGNVDIGTGLQPTPNIWSVQSGGGAFGPLTTLTAPGAGSVNPAGVGRPNLGRPSDGSRIFD